MKKAVLVLIAVGTMLTAIPAVSQAEMGVGVDWHGSSLTPVMILPIKMQSGLILEPFVGFQRTELTGGLDYSYAAAAQATTPSFTSIDLGLRVEKEMTAQGAAKPVFGGFAELMLNSPSDIFYTSDVEYDSWTNMSFGIYLGGCVSVTDGLDMVGGWGPTVNLMGEQTAGDATLAESATNFSSQAFITFRWWLWGM